MTKRLFSTAKDERGFAMAIAIFVLAVLISVTAAALRMSQADIFAARNYRSGSQALFAAEAGINHAIMIINQGGAGGVTNLQNDAVNGWSAIWGGSAKAMAQLTSYSYNVTLVQDATIYPGDPDRGVLTSIATGSDNSTRTVVARIRKSSLPASPPGAIYLATDNPTDSTFNGNAFSIDGNDWNMNNTAGPAPAVPGITTRNDANSTETRNSLNNPQKDNVTGLGFVPGSPSTPSVSTAQGMSSAQINQMITDLLALGPVPHDGDIHGGEKLGDCSANPPTPQITYVGPGNGSTYMENGNASGCGIMIVENGITINGNFDFYGLVIVRGTTQVTDVTGHMSLHGTLWTTEVNFRDGGSSDIRYSSQALALANQAGGPTGGLPAPVVVTAWRDVY